MDADADDKPGYFLHGLVYIFLLAKAQKLSEMQICLRGLRNSTLNIISVNKYQSAKDA
jgi:hypothetical protein